MRKSQLPVGWRWRLGRRNHDRRACRGVVAAGRANVDGACVVYVHTFSSLLLVASRFVFGSNRAGPLHEVLDRLCASLLFSFWGVDLLDSDV